MKIDRYRGDGLPPDGNYDNQFPYIADRGLVQAVNYAIVLKRPILVKGPPGCGKTRLAASIAHELGLPLHEWYIKSTSLAKDGLYSIDMVRRLQDAQMNKPEAQKLIPYIKFGPLGEAIKSENESVVLIDEIDKADIDFPNDLLREFDEKKFTIEELDERELSDENCQIDFKMTYHAKYSPIIVVTSNDEKELPDAFLRRCLFYYIDFPEKKRLIQIVNVNMPELKVEDKFIAVAIDRLDDLRSIGGFRKDPSTSELIDWVRILYHWGIEIEALEKVDRLTAIPAWKVLVKHQQDVLKLMRYEEKEMLT